MEIKGVNIAEITLHVGLGTFNPVEVEDLSKHKMDSEELIIGQHAVDIVNQSIRKKKKDLCRWYYCYERIGKFCFFNEYLKYI